MTDDNKFKIESLVSELLTQIGEDPNREGLLKTPQRVAKSWDFLSKGYEQNIDDIINDAIFYEDYDEMVTIRDIDFFSLCEHHLLPIIGRAHVAYISGGKVIGLSKMNRIVEYFSKRPQVQERLTMQIVQAMQEALGTKDVACVIDAKHLCVNSRGIKDIESSTVTSEFGGKFKEKETKKEFLQYLQMDTKL